MTKLLLTLALLPALSFAQYNPTYDTLPKIELSGNYEQDVKLLEDHLKFTTMLAYQSITNADRFRRTTYAAVTVGILGSALGAILLTTSSPEAGYVVIGASCASSFIINMVATSQFKPKPILTNPYPPPPARAEPDYEEE